VFFVGYFLFEIPSNLLLHKVGARIWIARILITWGTVAMMAAAAHQVIDVAERQMRYAKRQGPRFVLNRGLN
jgi:hypothetical protein